MKSNIPPVRRAHGGMVLVTSLLLLAVITMLALGMFRGFGVQEQIAGNLREKQRALHAALSAQQHAEWWLTQPGNVAAATVVCNDTILNANLDQGQVCVNRLTSVTNPPLQLDGADAGVSFNPGGAMNVTTTAARETYFRVPRFYIADIGPSADGSGEVYQVNAVGYGGTEGAVAVVESTFVVKTGVTDRGGP